MIILEIKCLKRASWLEASKFEQEGDFSVDEVYAPVAKITTVRLLLALSNKFNLFIHQVDICNAFLNGHLSGNVYINVPDGIYPDLDCNENVLKLSKALYGLKQAPKLWSSEFNKFICASGFVSSASDECLYIYSKDGVIVYLLLYVDDILICSKNLKDIEDIKSKINSKFKCRDLKVIKKFLGINVEYEKDGGVLKIGQIDLINKVAARFNVTDSHPVLTPIEKGIKLVRCSDKSKVTSKPYRELVGCLVYIMLSSRPDICFSISYFSQFQDGATDEHFKYLLRVLKYVYTTRDSKLTYNRVASNVCLEVYCDTDWANCIETRRSVSGCCALIYGSPILWFSRKQNLVTLSSTEAEMVALCSSVRETVWLKRILSEFNIDCNENCFIYEDNQSCIDLIKNGRWNSRRSKHIDTEYRFVVEKYCIDHFIVKYVPSSLQKADFFTKAESRINFYSFRNMLNLM